MMNTYKDIFTVHRFKTIYFLKEDYYDRWIYIDAGGGIMYTEFLIGSHWVSARIAHKLYKLCPPQYH